MKKQIKGFLKERTNQYFKKDLYKNCKSAKKESLLLLMSVIFVLIIEILVACLLGLAVVFIWNTAIIHIIPAMTEMAYIEVVVILLGLRVGKSIFNSVKPALEKTLEV